MRISLLLLSSTFVVISGLSGSSEAHMRYEKPLAAKMAYLFGMKDFDEPTPECQSLSGINLVCATQRSQTTEPVYLGFGVNVGTYEKWRFALEADYAPKSPFSRPTLLPTSDSDRGISLKGYLKFDVL